MTDSSVSTALQDGYTQLVSLRLLSIIHILLYEEIWLKCPNCSQLGSQC